MNNGNYDLKEELLKLEKIQKQGRFKSFLHKTTIFSLDIYFDCIDFELFGYDDSYGLLKLAIGNRGLGFEIEFDVFYIKYIIHRIRRNK